MSDHRFTESVVEDAALEWLAALGWAVLHGPEIAPGEIYAERASFGEVVLGRRLREALARLNPNLPPEAHGDVFRKLTRPDGPTLVARNHALHRMLVDGVRTHGPPPNIGSSSHRGAAQCLALPAARRALGRGAMHS